MRVRVSVLILGGVAVGFLLFPGSQHGGELPPPKAVAGQAPVAFACQGRIEGNGDPFEVSAAVDGVIERLLVREGQMVRKGQLVARIGCGEREAAIVAAEAAAESARNALVRLRRGSREEEREAAAQATRAARAVMENSLALARRYEGLLASGDVSRQMVENAQRDRAVAEASLARAEQQERLIQAGPLPEEVARLEADWRAAKAQVEAVRALEAKCEVRSPVSGYVVKVLRKEGESVSTFTPQPVAAIADLSVTRVRAEVDERDAGKVAVGQKAVVRVDESHVINGQVSGIAMRMGRKSILSAATGDKNDRDVLDVWIAVEEVGRLPLGLRVLVQFEAAR